MISVCHSRERHTADNLREALEHVLYEWGVGDVFAVVSDNAGNIVKALQQSNLVHHDVLCVGHTSQLAINDSLAAILLTLYFILIIY